MDRDSAKQDRGSAAQAADPTTGGFRVDTPQLSLPKGGGAIRGIGEKFAANPVTGTGSMSVPIMTSPGRSGFGPQLALSYDSGAGNGPFGFGWRLSLPSITRRTDKGLPQYSDVEDSDVFVLSGTEDLVPVFRQDVTGAWTLDAKGQFEIQEDDVDGYRVRRYRPRIEGLFARIERWTLIADARDVHWRSITKDNILTVYGRDMGSRIADPENTARIFSWLICETRDDKGNAVLYRYKAEDGLGVDVTLANERNRGSPDNMRRTANRYLKHIYYGNRTPLLDTAANRPRFLDEVQINTQIANAGWMFQVVFDFGEHNADLPKPSDPGAWSYRSDPFSVYRSGFEVRTTRRCHRVLMFHHFPDEKSIGVDCLVRSTDFTFSDDANPSDAQKPIYTFLKAVTQVGYRRNNGGYDKLNLPPVEFEYSQAVVQDAVQEISTDTMRNLPVGVDADYQLVDLHGEGIPGIFVEQAGAWLYKRNISPISKQTVEFAAQERVARRPNLALAGGSARFMDLDGDGDVDLVVLNGPAPGRFDHNADEGWEPFRPFTSRLNCDANEPNLKFVDLDGDGLIDVLISENDAFVWHASLAGEGFGTARRVAKSPDEEKGPRVVFADGTQSIYLADLSGDGLADLLRIRNGEICYWPNLGYGHFGGKVTMDNAPQFDSPDQFDQKRIRLADIDGSGTTDVIYLHRDGPRLYFNQAGNSWSKPQALRVAIRTEDLLSIVPADLLGNGTACLVWSSPLPSDARRQMRYVDLMGGQKPHLLISAINNLGAETRVGYAPSTKFYLQDKRDGTPWITKLPFPVQVVESVEIIDHVSRSRFVTRYAYHHGYYDGIEREFRGFGMVEQWDTEAYEDYVVGVKSLQGSQELAPELNQPPVTTRTWYHLGAALCIDRLLHQFRNEYYGQEQHIPEPTLPSSLNGDDFLECMRALKGLPLRQETYSFDGSTAANIPYAVVENNFEIRHIQPRGTMRHGVFFPVGRESVSLHYDRNPTDPRVVHTFGLVVDDVGNARHSCSVVYGRSLLDSSLPAEVTRDQQQLYITSVETDFTQDIDLRTPTDTYRLRVPCESRSYEVTGIAPISKLFEFADLSAKIAGASSIEYEIVADGVTPQRRLFSQGRTLYLDNNLIPLPLGQWASVGLGYQSYQLAFTPALLAAQYSGKVTDSELTAAGYLHFQGDIDWWIPSSTAIYSADPAKHFFLPIGAKDPLGVETTSVLDQYDLLPHRVECKQATWNVTSAVNDYRVLGPVQTTDLNKNSVSVEIDALGVVTKSAIMGKAGSGDGDTLADPTTRIEYELFNWMNNNKPNFVHVLAREQHGSSNLRWQESYAYSNGRGGVAMVKAQAHPGKAIKVNPDGTTVEVDANPRWVGSGRTILNNKGKPVKQYEPYFSVTNEYEDEKALSSIGSTPVLYYDAIGRNVLTEFSNGTFTKAEFNPWKQTTSDANDTVKESQWYIDRGSPNPATQPEPLSDAEKRAAWLAAKHADTPGVMHFDSLGRSAYAISDYGGGKTAAVRSESDLTGRLSKMFDQSQRRVASAFVGPAGTAMSSESAERGSRWTFQNVLGAVVKTWDGFGRQFRVEYDVLHRPLSTYVLETGLAELLFNYVVYGDRVANADTFNLLGTAHQIFEQAGMVRVLSVDFKGNPLVVERMLAKDYKNYIDWSVLASQPNYTAIQTAATPTLETSEVFSVTSQYDAINRPTQVALPDGTVFLPTYNEGNFLSSLQAKVLGQGNFIEFLKDQDCDAKGRRQFVQYGNDVFIRYFYDPLSFRLTNLVTYKLGDDPDTQGLQDLRYTYDPVGNITEVHDDAQQTHYFQNAVVAPQNLYEYDAIYQLIRASGREHAGLGNDTTRTNADLGSVPLLPDVNDSSAVRTYTEEYQYDLLGNIKVLSHQFQPQPGIGSGWIRRYRYAGDDSPTNRANRLTSTSLPGDPDAGPFSATYDYDDYGNTTRMANLTTMTWDFMDQLRKVDLGGGGTAYYVYDSDGQRIRKVIERQGTQRTERIYLGAVEIYRERQGTAKPYLERYTLRVADNGVCIAQIDIKSKDDNNRDPDNPLNVPLIRYQFTNHLGSAALETNADGTVISYEEYHPYGTSSYRSAKPTFNLSLKRYRFSNTELDDESGLYYFGARYYAPWLARWTSCDPAGYIDGYDLFRYCRNNPINRKDPTGSDSVDPSDVQVVEKRHFTGKETLDQLKALPVPKGAQFDPKVTEENLKDYYLKGPEKGGAGGVWAVLIPAGPQPARGAGSDAGSNPDAPPTDSIAPPSPPQETPEEATKDIDVDSGGEKERSFFTSSFFKGLVVGLAVTVAVVAIVATGGAALAVIAPAASAAIAGSAAVGTAVTALGVVGGAVAVTGVVQSVRQRDLWGNPISEEQANFNLGLGIGSFAGGALAKPVAAAVTPLGQGLGNAAVGFGESLENGGQFAIAGGGILGDAIAVPVGGISATTAVGTAGTAMGGNTLMMAGHEADWELRDPNGRISTRGSEASGSDTPPGRRLSWDEQLQVHTERKILSQLGGKVKPGQTITIRGTKPPCDPGGRGCASAMRAFAEKYGVKIIYRNTATGQSWSFP